jgi:ribosome-associated protein
MLRTGDLTTLADYFVIATGRSDRQVSALAGALVEELRAQGVRPLGVEGRSGARWVLLDFTDVIVHLFTPDERERYDLERLWSAAPAVVGLVCRRARRVMASAAGTPQVPRRDPSWSVDAPPHWRPFLTTEYQRRVRGSY